MESGDKFAAGPQAVDFLEILLSVQVKVLTKLVENPIAVSINFGNQMSISILTADKLANCIINSSKKYRFTVAIGINDIKRI